MGTVTLSLPEEFKSKIDKYSRIKWSEIFRKMISSKVEQLEKLEENKR
jgi:metal-responsive CopG/Arc/MetJ family transcriptional regulator